jgi:hypothetical protein
MFVSYRFNATYRQSKNSKLKGVKGNAAVSGKVKKAIPMGKQIPKRPVLSSTATSRSDTVLTSDNLMEHAFTGASKLSQRLHLTPTTIPTPRLLTNKELRERFLPDSAHHSDEDPEYEDDGDDEEEEGPMSDEEVADAFAADSDSDDDFEGTRRILPPRKRIRVRNR